MIRKLIIFIPFLALSCAVTDRENDGPVFCTIDQQETYALGTANPGADFDVTNLTKTTAFNDTDCPRVNNAPFTVFIDRANRVNTTVQIIENQFKPHQKLLEFQVAGTTMLPIRSVININNCSIIQEWSGVIDTVGNTLSVNEVLTYKGACQSIFYNPEFDTTNPGQNI